MALSSGDVQRIAHLARIEITPEEAAEVEAKLAGIFALIEKMRGVDTTGIVPMAHAQDVALPLRDDVVTEDDRHELYQGVAPAVQSGLYLVPKVVE
ncbi:MAG TPA: Asp-tRNA(Asn)/Glu-tRNA(Gln) amidotransferase subunit GatC [Casimicrobiaceae bacterium]|nr:Asp-tRNA(Asn)/Glu-tRNA(Gln) amidotransferase subunit GatC [Casimicrobiaceae bacterium]